MKKLALCALVLGAGLAASRADVSLGIRIGINDRHDHHADYRSSRDYNHYRTQHQPYVPPAVVRCEPVVVACPVCGRAVIHEWARYREYAAYRPAEVCVDHRRYVVAEPVCAPRTRW